MQVKWGAVQIANASGRDRVMSLPEQEASVWNFRHK
jgi:hypothetical protein